MEEVEEDRIYWIGPWEAHQRGRTDGEGARRDLLAAMEDNAHALFSHPTSGEDEEE